MAFDRIKPWKSIEFNQSAEIPRALVGWHLTPREITRHPSVSGVCYSLCMDWMKRKLSQKEKGAQRVGNLDVDRAIQRQGMYKEIWKASDGKSYEAGERSLGIRMVECKALNAPLWSGAAWYIDRIAVHYRGGAGKAFLMEYAFHRYDANAWKPGGGAHAVAWYVSHGTWGIGGLMGGRHIYLFDPNCGEYRMQEGDLNTFLGSYLEDVKDAFAPHLFPMTFSLRTFEGGTSSSQKVEKSAVNALQRQLQDKMKKGGA